MRYAVITATGKASEGLIPVGTGEFSRHTFYDPKTRKPFEKPTAQILEEFERVTGVKVPGSDTEMLVPGITSRLYARPGVTTTDLGVEAFSNTGFKPEDLDDLVVATNFADGEVNWLPAMAVQTMNRLDIKNGSGVVGVDFLCDDNTGALVADELSHSGKLGNVWYGDSTQVRSLEDFGDEVPNYVIHQARLPGEEKSVAERVNRRLGIRNPQLKMRDVPWGCAGFLKAVIQEKALIEGGFIDSAGIVAVENLPPNVDPHDRDLMLYGAGAGAVIMESGDESTRGLRILSYEQQTHPEFMDYLTMGPSCNPDHPQDEMFMRMKGSDVYKWFVKNMRGVIDISLERASEVLGKTIRPRDVDLWNIHQAQPRLDYAVMETMGMSMETIYERVPITAGIEGNPSVVSNPRILDGCYKGEWGDRFRLKRDDIVVMGSGGAGMNLAAVVGVVQ